MSIPYLAKAQRSWADVTPTRRRVRPSARDAKPPLLPLTRREQAEIARKERGIRQQGRTRQAAMALSGAGSLQGGLFRLDGPLGRLAQIAGLSAPTTSRLLDDLGFVMRFLGGKPHRYVWERPAAVPLERVIEERWPGHG